MPTNLQIIQLTTIPNDECEAHESHLCTEMPVGQGMCDVSHFEDLEYRRNISIFFIFFK